MARGTPMDLLRDLAEQTLNETTLQLGRARQAHESEAARLDQLQEYEQEYRRQLQHSLAGAGIAVTTIQMYQGFIGALGRVVTHQTRQVVHAQQTLDTSLSAWQQDRKRLNAFDTLKARADARRVQHENRQEQKMMDEFARRTGMRTK